MPQIRDTETAQKHPINYPKSTLVTNVLFIQLSYTLSSYRSNIYNEFMFRRQYIPTMIISVWCVKTGRVHIFNGALLRGTKVDFWQTSGVLIGKDHSFRKNMFAIPPRGVISFWYQPMAYITCML